MTKRRKLVIRSAIIAGAVTAGVVPTLAVVACGSTEALKQATVEYLNVPAFAYKGDSMSAKKLYSIMSDPENPRWQKARSEIEKSGGEAKFSSVIAQIQKDQTSQNAALNTAIQTAYDAYILGATDDGGFSDQISKINTANQAPVIAYDRLIKQNYANYNWYVTFDSNQVGRLQGLSIVNALYGSTFTKVDTTDAQITKAVTDKKNTTKMTILPMGGDPSDNNAELFYNGAKKVLDVVAAADTNLNLPANLWSFKTAANVKWDYTAAKNKLQTQITALSAADKQTVVAILAPNDGMADSATSALNNTGLDPKKIWITGLDSNDKAIIDINNDAGQDMTVFKPDYALARVAVALATKLISDKDAKKTSTEAEIIDYITKTAYSDLATYDLKVDATGYKVSTEASAKAIKTILLNPILITKSNLAQYFKVVNS